MQTVEKSLNRIRNRKQIRRGRTCALIIASTIMIISVVTTFLPPACPADVGLSVDSVIYKRLTYPFFHASLIHALINVWCLLSVVFTYRISMMQISVALIITASVPEIVLSGIPTVGISGVCYALLGMAATVSRRPIYFTLFVLVSVSIGFLFPSVNALLHLHCFFTGAVCSPVVRHIERMKQMIMTDKDYDG